MATYTGGCHCKAVRFEVESDLTPAVECNCSHCDIKGLVLTFVPAERFKLLSGEDDLALYQFNKMHIEHLFCRHCGVESFGRGKNPKGEDTRAINIRCLDGVDRSTLEITPVNGKAF